MHAAHLNGVSIHYRTDGPEDGPGLLFSNSLGTDFRIWDAILPLLKPGLRVIRYDKRGHGLSDLPEGTWGMADHVADAAALLDHLAVSNAVICGLSVGGMIAQGLAAERADLIRALVLCDTGAKIGSPEMWDQRIDAIKASGIASMADAVMERWFTPEFRQSDPAFPAYRNMLCRTTAGGYAGTCAAIRDTDLKESTSLLRLPCLGICGDQDGSTPPDMVRETVDLIPESRFELIRGAGHIPCVEQPQQLAAAINAFLDEINHI